MVGPLAAGAAAPPTDPATTPAVETQMELNIERYEAIYLSCRRAVDRVAEKAQLDPIERLELARQFFNRYCQDQLELESRAQASAPLKEQLEMLGDLLRRRGM